MNKAKIEVLKHKSKRISKDPEVRKNEIINVSLILFEQNGYTRTSVEDIIKTVGIAKGTFYYYFKTKYDILSAIVEKIGTGIEEYFLEILAQTNLSAIEKLKLIFTKQQLEGINTPLIMDVIHKSENRELQEKLNIFSIEKLALIIAKVFYQGYQEGSFSKLVTEEDVQLILSMIQVIFDSGLFVWSNDKKHALLVSAKNILHLVSGATPDQFDFILGVKL